jgi:hypothetical protein
MTSLKPFDKALCPASLFEKRILGLFSARR